jgi:hypothetical protein
MDNPFEVIDRRLNRIEDLLVELTGHLRSTTIAATSEIGGIALAQEVTRLSKARLYALVAARQIPHAKRGNKLYFTRADLQTWIAAGQRNSRAE